MKRLTAEIFLFNRYKKYMSVKSFKEMQEELLPLRRVAVLMEEYHKEKLEELNSKKMKTLTKEQFDLIPRGEVFATGILPNSPSGLFMTNNFYGNLRWVAKKGYGYDWAIYCHWEEHDKEWVTAHGDKVTGEEHIKRCVPCEEEVFSLYRY